MAAYSLPMTRWFYQGAPASNGNLYVYQTGTTTPVAIFSDANLTVAAANPVVLDSNGEAHFYVAASTALRLDAYTSGGTLIESIDPVYPAIAPFSNWCGTAGGTANAIVLSPSPPVNSYYGGLWLSFTAYLANTGTTTISTPNGGAKPAFRDTYFGPVPLQGGELSAGNLYEADYDPTLNFNGGGWHVYGTSLAPLSSGGFKNIITGGEFTTNPWQRGTTFSGLTGGAAYTADRWAFSCTTSTTATVSKSGTGIGQYIYGARVQRNSGSTSTGNHLFTQLIRSIDMLALQGQQCTLSFFGRCGSTYSPTSSLLWAVITGGTGEDEGLVSFVDGTWTGQNTVKLQSFAVAPTYPGYPFTVNFTVPANAGELAVSFYSQPIGTAGADDWFEVAAVQLELGNAATSFETLPATDVLLRCQASFWKSFPQGTAPAQASGVQDGAIMYRSWVGGAVAVSVAVDCPVSMYTTPSLTFYNPISANNYWRNLTANTDSAPGRIDIGVSPDRILTGNTQLSADTAGQIYAIHLTASADL